MKSIRFGTAPGIGFAILMFLLFGCDPEPTLQIVRVPLVSPVVLPSPNTGAFIITAAVYNYGDQPTPPGKLGMTPLFACVSCGDYFVYYTIVFDFPALAPGQGWVPIKDRLIADPARVSVGCFRGDCYGWVELTLFDQAGSRIYGQNTHFDVGWQEDGNLSSMTTFDLP